MSNSIDGVLAQIRQASQFHHGSNQATSDVTDKFKHQGFSTTFASSLSLAASSLSLAAPGL